jgi:GT2 family glycosyltransferase
VIVDNASADESVGRLSEWISRNGQDLDVRLLRADTNLGFSGGNNLALAALSEMSEVTHFLLLNNDTRVEPAFFGAMSRAVRALPEAGLLTSTIMYADEPARVWYAGGYFQTWRALAHHRRTIPAAREPQSTEFITGCVLMISRPAFERLGPLPECYFPGYLEDTEYSYRAGLLGVTRWYIPEAVVHHRIGASTAGGPAADVVRWTVRHRGYFVRRNLRGAHRLVALAYLLATKPGRALLHQLRGRSDLARAYLLGMLEGFFRPTGAAPNGSTRQSTAVPRPAAPSAPSRARGERS